MTDVRSEPSETLRDRTRSQIVAVAAELLAQGGRDAVTTRAVTAAAGVQAPTIYRLFGDKAGLLDAVAERGFTAYLADKQPPDSGADPVEALRVGWDLHIGFGLANPALYCLMYGEPRPGVAPPAAEAAFRILRTHVRHVAEAGRLRLGEEQAAAFIHASGSGTVLTLLALPEDERDLSLSTFAREACLAAITTDDSTLETPGVVGAAVALRATLPDVTALTEAECGVLTEWLDRIAAQAR
jgi:AcrR family transcriptional regulator